MPVTVGAAIHFYLDKKQTDEAWAEDTAKGHRSTLNCWHREIKAMFGHDPDLDDLTTPIIKRAIERRWPNNGETGTWAAQANRVKGFFRWLRMKGYDLGDVDGFISLRIEKPDIDKKYSNRLEIEQVRETFQPRGDWWSIFLFLWVFQSHRRAGEANRFKWKDIDFTPRGDAPHGVYWYRDKKTRSNNRVMVDLTPTEAEILQQWKEIYTRQAGEPELEWYVFPALKPISAPIEGHKRVMAMIPWKAIGKMSHYSKKIMEEAGIYEKRKGWHALRRGGMEEAWQILKKLGFQDPIGLIMPRSGHKTRETAEGYLDKNKNKLLSTKAYLAMDQERRNPQPAEEISDENPDITHLPGNVSSNVVDISSRFQRRA